MISFCIYSSSKGKRYSPFYDWEPFLWWNDRVHDRSVRQITHSLNHTRVAQELACPAAELGRKTTVCVAITNACRGRMYFEETFVSLLPDHLLSDGHLSGGVGGEIAAVKRDMCVHVFYKQPATAAECPGAVVEHPSV